MHTVLEFISTLIFVLTFTGFFGRIWWGFTLAGFFRLQYATLALIGLFWSFAYSALDLLLLNAITFAVNMMLMQGWLPKKHQMNGHHVDIAAVNIWKDNKRPERLKRYLEKYTPDILLLMEVTDTLKDEQPSIFNTFPYGMSHYVRDGFEIHLLSKLELKDTEILKIGPDGTPLLSCMIQFAGQKVRLFSAHPKPAISQKYYRDRQAYFKELQEVIARETLPVIALGDFNSVPWEPHFRAFLEKTGLRSSLEECGYKMTWPRYFPPLGIPMDHILISRSIEINDLKIGPNVGSDHFPVAVSLKKELPD